jgi:GTPase SAR1 family protein
LQNVILDQDSFDSVEKWVEDARTERGQDCVIMVVGNKIDLEDGEREVTKVEGEIRARALKCVFAECSAKKGNVFFFFFKILSYLGINFMFRIITEEMFKLIQKSEGLIE